MLATTIRMVQEQFDHQWAGYLVGKVGHEGPVLFSQCRDEVIIQPPPTSETVASNERQPAAESFLNEVSKALIHFAGDYSCSGVQQCFCQRACTRSNFQDKLALGNAGGLDQLFQLVVVMEKVLAETPSRGQATIGQQFADFREGLHVSPSPSFTLGPAGDDPGLGLASGYQKLTSPSEAPNRVSPRIES